MTFAKEINILKKQAAGFDIDLLNSTYHDMEMESFVMDFIEKLNKSQGS